jgi:hypothetical protein
VLLIKNASLPASLGITPLHGGYAVTNSLIEFETTSVAKCCQHKVVTRRGGIRPPLDKPCRRFLFASNQLPTRQMNSLGWF